MFTCVHLFFSLPAGGAVNIHFWGDNQWEFLLHLMHFKKPNYVELI